MYKKLAKPQISVMSIKDKKTLQMQMLVCINNKYSFVNSINTSRVSNVNQ